MKTHRALLLVFRQFYNVKKEIDTMKRAECIITGCIFFDALSGRFVNGDLFRLGQTLLHVVNMKQADEEEEMRPPHPNVEIDWQYGTPPLSCKVVACTDGSYFDKRGVIVFALSSSDMNDTAIQYLRGSR